MCVCVCVRMCFKIRSSSAKEMNTVPDRLS